MQDFYDFTAHWQNSLPDLDLVSAKEEGRYCPEVEDISLDDETLYEAVEQIEFE